jgi:hypothetical protein
LHCFLLPWFVVFYHRSSHGMAGPTSDTMWWPVVGTVFLSLYVTMALKRLASKYNNNMLLKSKSWFLHDSGNANLTFLTLFIVIYNIKWNSASHAFDWKAVRKNYIYILWQNRVVIFHHMFVYYIIFGLVLVKSDGISWMWKHGNNALYCPNGDHCGCVNKHERIS